MASSPAILTNYPHTSSRLPTASPPMPSMRRLLVAFRAADGLEDMVEEPDEGVGSIEELAA